MAPLRILEFSARTIEYLVADRDAFVRNLDPSSSGPRVGGLGFAMIASACAAVDTYAYLLYDAPEDESGWRVKELMKSRFFDQTKYIEAGFFWDVIRCGVLHQLYPKHAEIVVIQSNLILYRRPEGTRHVPCLNALALYFDVIRGIKEIHKRLASDPIFASDCQRRLTHRQQQDEKIRWTWDLSRIPELPKPLSSPPPPPASTSSIR